MARVAFVTTSYPRYGGDPSGHFVELEATARALRGDTVIVLAPGTRRAPNENVAVVGLPGASAFGWPGALARLRERPLLTLAATAFVASACRRLRALGTFDEIVAHWLLPSGFPIGVFGNGPLEVVLHGSDVRVFRRLPRPARTAIVDRLLARDARFRFVSSKLRDQFVRATMPQIVERSVVAPCPIDVGGAPSRAEARKRFGIPADEKIAVIVGRLVAAKRPREALEIALERNPDRVVVVGDGPLRGAMDTDSRVVTVGAKAHADTLAWISAADYLVSASRLEGAPTVIREARALGVSVVAAECGDLAEWARADPGIEIVASGSRTAD